MSELREGLELFPDNARVTLDYVPETWEFSSAPRNPSRLYIVVEELSELLHEDDEKKLQEMGWGREQDGEVWVLYDL